MSVVEPIRTSAKPQYQSGGALLLQRKCACGGTAGFSGECEDCQKDRPLGKPLQAKLRVNEPGDAYEQEADRVSDQVMRMAVPPVPADPDGPPLADAPRVQRRVSDGGAAGTGTAPPIVHEVLSGPGEPLDAASRNFFEPRFGHDFSHVRVHADARAVASARAVNAHAYTVGSHVVLGGGRQVANGEAGRRLLAHELTHAVQQGETTRTDGLILRQEGVDVDTDTDIDLSNDVDVDVDIDAYVFQHEQEWRNKGWLYGHYLCLAASVIDIHNSSVPNNEDWLFANLDAKPFIGFVDGQPDGRWRLVTPVTIDDPRYVEPFVDGINQGIQDEAKLNALFEPIYTGLTLLSINLSARAMTEVTPVAPTAERPPRLVVIIEEGPSPTFRPPQATAEPTTTPSQATVVGEGTRPLVGEPTNPSSGVPKTPGAGVAKTRPPRTKEPGPPSAGTLVLDEPAAGPRPVAQPGNNRPVLDEPSGTSHTPEPAAEKVATVTPTPEGGQAAPVTSMSQGGPTALVQPPSVETQPKLEPNAGHKEVEEKAPPETATEKEVSARKDPDLEQKEDDKSKRPCPEQTIIMSEAHCKNRYGASAFLFYSFDTGVRAAGWWWKEEVVPSTVSAGGTPCQRGPIDQRRDPTQMPTGYAQDEIVNTNGPPSNVAPCMDTTFQTVFIGPTRDEVEQCQYHNRQVIQVVINKNTRLKSGDVITSSNPSSTVGDDQNTSCPWKARR